MTIPSCTTPDVARADFVKASEDYLRMLGSLDTRRCWTLQGIRDLQRVTNLVLKAFTNYYGLNRTPHDRLERLVINTYFPSNVQGSADLLSGNLQLTEAALEKRAELDRERKKKPEVAGCKTTKLSFRIEDRLPLPELAIPFAQARLSSPSFLKKYKF
ncbi:MAG: hypothetical protein HY860_00630 [Chlamydiales bacterium]|nr:hypothetical protein [Chlamydiales bacterium]